MLGRDPQRTLFSTSTFGNPRASQRCGLAIETNRCGECQALVGCKGLDPIHTRCVFSPIILGDATHCQQPGIPRLHEQFLKLVCGSDISTLRGSVNPLLEVENTPVDFLPRNVLPGHLQGLALRFGSLPLTHRFTFQDTGPTSAYPGHYPWRWLLRASSSPAASGWHLLREVIGLTEGRWRLLRSQFPWLASVGWCSPPGFCGSADRSVSKAAGAVSCAVLAPARQPLALGDGHDGSTTPLLPLPIDACETGYPD